MENLEHLLQQYFAPIQPSTNFEKKFWEKATQRESAPSFAAGLREPGFMFAAVAALIFAAAIGGLVGVGQEHRRAEQAIVTEQLSLHELGNVAPESLAGTYLQLSGISF